MKAYIRRGRLCDSEPLQNGWLKQLKLFISLEGLETISKVKGYF